MGCCEGSQGFSDFSGVSLEICVGSWRPRLPAVAGSDSGAVTRLLMALEAWRFEGAN